MKEVVLMFGLPGSGKSFYIKENLKDWIIVDPDREIDLSNGQSLHQQHIDGNKRAVKEIIENAQAGNNFVIDAPNINFDAPPLTVRTLKKLGYKITLIYLATPLKECLRRNKARERNVPEHVIIESNKRKRAVFAKLKSLVDEVKIV